jgi:hypothetical protein
MGFWGVWVGSHCVKNVNEVMPFYRKVGQCNTLKGKKEKSQFGVVEKKLCCPDDIF